MQQIKQRSVVVSAESKSTDKKRKVTVGSVWKSKNYGEFEVVEYIGCRNVKVRFFDTGFVTKTQAVHVASGNVKDRMAMSVCGVGTVGVGECPITKNRMAVKAYGVWRSMLERCYNEKFQSKRQTYIGCTVCQEWHNYQNFARWYKENYPKDGGDYELDKDLKIAGNKFYSPDTCMFVSGMVNRFTIDSGAARGDFMIGVCFSTSSGKFISQCSNPINATREHLGYHTSEIDAHMAWRKRKSELAYELAMVQKNDEVKQALLNWKGALDNFEIHKI